MAADDNFSAVQFGLDGRHKPTSGNARSDEWDEGESGKSALGNNRREG